MKPLLLALLLAAGLPADDKPDLYAIHRIKDEALKRSKVADHLFQFSEVYGSRLTNSPGFRGASDWVVKQLREWGIDGARLHKFEFGRGWALNRFEAHMLEPEKTSLIVLPGAWTPGTNGPVVAEAMLAPMPPSLAEFEKYIAQHKGKLKGKAVLVTPPYARDMPWGLQSERLSHDDIDKLVLAPEPRSGASRPNRPPYPRSKFINFLKQEGVVILIANGGGRSGVVRSSWQGSRNVKDPAPPPMAALAGEHYNRIARLLEKGTPVKLEFGIDAKLLDDDLSSSNVIAELPGREKRDEVVMFGAHLDSIGGGTGAVDNGAGSSVALEAMRILKTLNLPLKRTVRLALWGGEEEGLLGARAYVKENFGDRETMILKPDQARVSCYFNLDYGSGKIRGIYISGNDMAKPVFDQWLAPLKDLGAASVAVRDIPFGGSDHTAFEEVGIPGFMFIQDPLGYFNHIHSNMDLYDRANPADMMQAAAVVASMVYLTANREELIPRKPAPQPRKEIPLKTDIEFAKVDDVSLTLDAYVPPGEGPFPAVIVVHGGGFVRGDKQTFVKPLFQPLTEAGFAWFTINYRLAPKYPFPAAVEDVERAIEWLRKNAKDYKVDPNRIALLGESAGGHLVSFAGAKSRPETTVQAVVSFYGPHDFEARYKKMGQATDNLKQFLAIKEVDKAALRKMREASPATYVSKGMPPFLFIHGTDDKPVPHDQSELMCEKMKRAGNTCEVFLLPGAPHGVGAWEHDARFHVYKPKMVEWLKQTLNK
jgi:acetyl esterase/lipase